MNDIIIHEMYEAETNIAKYLKARINRPDELFDEDEVERLLKNYEKKQGITLCAKTKRSIKLFLKIIGDDFNWWSRNR